MVNYCEGGEVAKRSAIYLCYVVGFPVTSLTPLLAAKNGLGRKKVGPRYLGMLQSL